MNTAVASIAIATLITFIITMAVFYNKPTSFFQVAMALARNNVCSLNKDISDIHKLLLALTAEPMNSIQNVHTVESGLTGRGASGYYHFSSDGKRLSSKWDRFDVDGELRKLDADGPSSPNQDRSKIDKHAIAAPSIAERVRQADALLRDLGCIEHGCEVVLSDLDSLSLPADGHAERVQRKGVVGELHAILKQVDNARDSIKKWRKGMPER